MSFTCPCELSHDPSRLTGMSPFLGDNDMETISNVTSGEFEWPEPDPDESIEVLSAPARDFIEKLLAKRPK